MTGSMHTAVFLLGSAVLLGLSPISVAIGRLRSATAIIYAASFAVSLGLCGFALSALLGEGAASALTLPLGLPWVGAHFRVDALASFFLARGQSGRGGGQPLWHRLWPA